MNYQQLRKISQENTAKQLLLHQTKEKLRFDQDKIKTLERTKAQALQQQLIANAEVARDQRQREEDKKLDELNKLQAKNPYGKREQPKPKNQSKQSTSKPSSNVRAPAKQPVQLYREQREAKRRAALFDGDSDDELTGGMALAQAQKSKILSPAAGFNTNQPGTLTLQRTLSNTAPARSRPPIPAKRGGSNSNSKVPTKNGSARERLLASFNPNETMKLNTDKRDTRTIDEIETDMRKKRSSLLSSTKAPTPLSHGHQNSRSVIPVTKGTTNPRSTASVASSSTRPITSASSSLNSKPSQSHNKRPRPSSRSSSSSDSQDDQSSRPSAVSQQIQLMFGRRDAKQYVDDYSDEDDDMEASNADVLKEEARAARMAAKEEADEVETSRQRAEEKRIRLRQQRQS